MITPSAEWLEADGLGGFAFGVGEALRLAERVLHSDNDVSNHAPAPIARAG